MEKKKIKAGLNKYIGDKTLFTSEVKEKILLQTKRRSTPTKKKSTYLKPITSVIAVMLVFTGFILFILWNHDQNNIASEQNDSTTELYSKDVPDEANEEMSDMEESDEDRTFGSAAESEEIENLEMENTQLNDEIERLKQQLDEELPQQSISILREKGFEGDISDIKQDLMENPEVIPYEGVLGGTMGFYHEDEIRVLSHEWVFAFFGDGHIGGYLLLKYTINNGEIEKWEVIESFLPE